MNLLSTPTVDGVHSAMATKARLEANIRWRAANPEKYRAAIKAWGVNNREKQRAYVKKWRDAHPEYAERRRALARESRKSPERLASARDYFHKTPVIGSWAGWLIRSARAGRTAKKHGAPTITEATLLTLWEEQDGRCFWSGIEMSHARNHPWKVSLDRLDNSKGYEPGNVCLATWFMNRARGSMSVEEFRTSLLTVAANVYEVFDEPVE